MNRPDRLTASAPLVWTATGALVLALLLLRDSAPWLQRVPPALVVDFEGFLNLTTRAFAETLQPFFRFLSWLFGWPIMWLRVGLASLPWLTVVCATSAAAFAVGGWRLALFAAAALLYIAVTGYWTAAMLTLSLVAVAVPVSVLAGLAIGIAAHRRRPVRGFVQPALDLMQTVPTFAYLIPILVLFGVGPVVGMLASAIYAIPPMVRNVMLGLDRVPADVLEPAEMAGSTARQVLWWVKLPTALPAILLGVNQTIMAVLSMVVIASILGGLEDIGWELYTRMKKAQFGESILAGMVVALLAMVLDRLSYGLAGRRRLAESEPTSHRILWLSTGVIGASLALATLFPVFWNYPEAWRIYPASEINAGLEWFTRNFFWLTQSVKNVALYYILQPLKFGLLQSATPSVWGFEINLVTGVLFAFLAGLAAVVAAWTAGWPAAVAFASAALVYFYGLLGLPWLVLVALVCVAGFMAGGVRLGLLAGGGLLLVALSGAWDQAMLSVQLAAAGVAISFFAGSALGIWAALNDRVSTFLRPINDTLQTMPIFVFLIPAVMIFLVGEFTALVAIVLYAIVPSIRYAEHGIRNVPAHVVEAASAFGATGRQLFWQVRLPLAFPEFMLGLNQTIMMALTMVVVAALVGAKGLGEDILVALTWMDVGKGLVYGLNVAVIAIITDRIIQAWSVTRKAALGLE